MMTRQQCEDLFNWLCRQAYGSDLRPPKSDYMLLVAINEVLHTHNCIPFSDKEIDDLLDKII